MNNSGDPVFGDNIDEILSNKIINHTEMSEKDDDIKENYNTKKSSLNPLFKIASFTILVALFLYAFKQIFYKLSSKN